MRSPLIMMAAVLLSVMATIVWPADHAQIQEQIQQKKIVLGQSTSHVRMVIGEPTKITKTRTYWESTEDWVYGEGKKATSFTFQEGRLTRITEGGRSPID